MPATSPSDERGVVVAAAELVATETPERIDHLVALLRAGKLASTAPAAVLQDQLGLPAARLVLYDKLLKAASETGATPNEIALILEGASAAADRIHSVAPLVEIARTGPSGGVFRLRTTGTVSREIIQSATRTLLLVGYSVTSSPNHAGLAAHTLESVRGAAARGVVVTALLHRDPRNRDALLASWPAALPRPSIFTWPESHTAPMAKLHAKAIVADAREALVTSANLTYHGYEMNIELGVRVSGDPAKLVEQHFRELIRSEELVVWSDSPVAG